MNEIKFPSAVSNYQWVGKNTPRPDGVDKVTGRARYGDDIILPGMLHGKLSQSTCPRKDHLCRHLEGKGC